MLLVYFFQTKNESAFFQFLFTYQKYNILNKIILKYTWLMLKSIQKSLRIFGLYLYLHVQVYSNKSALRWNRLE